MKIAIIGAKSFPAIGGAAETVESLLHYLSDIHEMTVYLYEHDRAHLEHINYKTIIIKVPRQKRLKTLIYYLHSCIHALFCGDYDLIHIQHIYSGLIVPLLKIKYKVITTVHGIIPTDDDKWNRFDKIFFKVIEIISLFFSDQVVSVSQPQIKYLQKINNRNIIYLPNGVHSGTDKYVLETPTFELVFSAARIIKIKGCAILLKALHKINYENKIKIIGSLEHVPKHSEEIKRLAKGLNISFCGLIKDKRQLKKELRSAKIFVFPSTKEGFSNMLLEVAALRIPIISSDIEENRAVFDYDDVLFFENGNSTDLGDKILYAITHEKEMTLKAESAYIKVMTSYNWENIAHEYAKLFENIQN